MASGHPQVCPVEGALYPNDSIFAMGPEQKCFCTRVLHWLYDNLEVLVVRVIVSVADGSDLCLLGDECTCARVIVWFGTPSLRPRFHAQGLCRRAGLGVTDMVTGEVRVPSGCQWAGEAGTWQHVGRGRQVRRRRPGGAQV